MPFLLPRRRQMSGGAAVTMERNRCAGASFGVREEPLEVLQHRRWRGFGVRRSVAGALAVAVLGLAPAAMAPDPAAAPVPTAAALAADSQLSITVTPNPGYVGGNVTVNFVVTYTGSGPGTVQFVVYPTLPSGMKASPMPPECGPDPNGGCTLPTIPQQPTTLTVPFTLSPSAPGTYTIIGQLSETTFVPSSKTFDTAAASEDPPQPPVSAVLAVLQPTISVLPPVVSPGKVVLVEGRDFPPGAVVNLRWSPGITAAAVPPVVGAAGTFTTQLLVIGGDRTGRRLAVASGDGFAAADAPVLVTPNRLMPPLLGASR